MHKYSNAYSPSMDHVRFGSRPSTLRQYGSTPWEHPTSPGRLSCTGSATASPSADRTSAGRRWSPSSRTVQKINQNKLNLMIYMCVHGQKKLGPSLVIWISLKFIFIGFTSVALTLIAPSFEIEQKAYPSGDKPQNKFENLDMFKLELKNANKLSATTLSVIVPKFLGAKTWMFWCPGRTSEGGSCVETIFNRKWPARKRSPTSYEFWSRSLWNEWTNIPSMKYERQGISQIRALGHWDPAGKRVCCFKQQNQRQETLQSTKAAQRSNEIEPILPLSLFRRHSGPDPVGWARVPSFTTCSRNLAFFEDEHFEKELPTAENVFRLLFFAVACKASDWGPNLRIRILQANLFSPPNPIFWPFPGQKLKTVLCSAAPIVSDLLHYPTRGAWLWPVNHESTLTIDLTGCQSSPPKPLNPDQHLQILVFLKGKQMNK